MNDVHSAVESAMIEADMTRAKRAKRRDALALLDFAISTDVMNDKLPAVSRKSSPHPKRAIVIAIANQCIYR